MLTEETLQEFTKRFQTSEKNIAREYVQHLLLSGLYKAKGSENLLFKGGTALRIVFQSPRFSEDLDFTGQNIFHYKDIDSLFLEALSEVEKTGIPISYKEAKPTTGGYLGLIHYEVLGISEDMKFEVSLRKTKKTKSEVVSIISDFIPPYTLFHLPAQEIIKGKLDALFDRKKPRDYYDLYFSLRHPQLNKYIDKNSLKAVKEILKKEQINFKKELSMLLPISHHMILKDFKNNLIKEMERYL